MIDENLSENHWRNSGWKINPERKDKSKIAVQRDAESLARKRVMDLIDERQYAIEEDELF